MIFKSKCQIYLTISSVQPLTYGNVINYQDWQFALNSKIPPQTVTHLLSDNYPICMQMRAEYRQHA